MEVIFKGITGFAVYLHVKKDKVDSFFQLLDQCFSLVCLFEDLLAVFYDNLCILPLLLETCFIEMTECAFSIVMKVLFKTL